MYKNTLFVVLIGFSFLITACSSDEKQPLPGERISVATYQKTPISQLSDTEDAAIEIPKAWQNQFWPQAGGYPNHAMHHLKLGEGALRQIWRTDIGEGTNDRIPLTTQPIVVEGRVFTMDTEARISAFDAQTGKRIWRVKARHKKEDDAVIRGGLSFAEGRIFATNGYNEVLALSSEDGEILWRKNLPAPSRAAPTSINGRVFVTTLDNRLVALDVNDGSSLWEYTGINETAGVIGAASPAANNDIVVPAFSSGEIVALRVENGSVAWSENLSNVRSIGGLSDLSDIRAFPILDQGLVVAMSFGGKIIGVDDVSGVRIWDKEIGGIQTPWVAGEVIYLITSNSEVLALNKRNGDILWVRDLAVNEESDEKVNWIGPILAGERLFVFGSHGIVMTLAPENGDVLGDFDTDHSLSIPPVVANETLFILANDATLLAYQ